MSEVKIKVREGLYRHNTTGDLHDVIASAINTTNDPKKGEWLVVYRDVKTGHVFACSATQFVECFRPDAAQEQPLAGPKVDAMGTVSTILDMVPAPVQRVLLELTGICGHVEWMPFAIVGIGLGMPSQNEVWNCKISLSISAPSEVLSSEHGGDLRAATLGAMRSFRDKALAVEKRRRDVAGMQQIEAVRSTMLLGADQVRRIAEKTSEVIVLIEASWPEKSGEASR